MKENYEVNVLRFICCIRTQRVKYVQFHCMVLVQVSCLQNTYPIHCKWHSPCTWDTQKVYSPIHLAIEKCHSCFYRYLVQLVPTLGGLPSMKTYSFFKMKQWQKNQEGMKQGWKYGIVKFDCVVFDDINRDYTILLFI